MGSKHEGGGEENVSDEEGRGKEWNMGGGGLKREGKNSQIQLTTL